MMLAGGHGFAGLRRKKGVTLLMILVQRREGEMGFCLCFAVEFVFSCDFGGRGRGRGRGRGGWRQW